MPHGNVRIAQKVVGTFQVPLQATDLTLRHEAHRPDLRASPVQMKCLWSAKPTVPPLAGARGQSSLATALAVLWNANGTPANHNALYSKTLLASCPKLSLPQMHSCQCSGANAPQKCLCKGLAVSQRPTLSLPPLHSLLPFPPLDICPPLNPLDWAAPADDGAVSAQPVCDVVLAAAHALIERVHAIAVAGL